MHNNQEKILKTTATLIKFFHNTRINIDRHNRLQRNDNELVYISGPQQYGVNFHMKKMFCFFLKFK